MGGRLGERGGSEGLRGCVCVRACVCLCVCVRVPVWMRGGGYIEICKALLNSVVYWCNVSCVVSYMYSALGEAR